MNGTQVEENGAEARQRNFIRLQGIKIAQAAHRSIGMSTRDPWGPPVSTPQYALAVSLIFTKATNQTIMLGTTPEHVLSTAHLWRSLSRDKRFQQVPLNEAAAGDIVVASHPSQADGCAGIVVDHGRVVGNSSRGVQNNSSLVEIQRSQPALELFRYIGIGGQRSHLIANEGFHSDEPRIPAGQPGGGQWTDRQTNLLLGKKDSGVDSLTGVLLGKQSGQGYTQRFLRMMRILFAWEGGYDNDPDDSGGETKYGIDKRSHPKVDIKNLTREQAMQIYWQEWLKSGCDQYPWPKGEVLFNTYVNGGKGLVQKILKKLGPNWTADQFLDELEAFYHRHVHAVQKDKKYLQGWLNRTEDLRRVIHGGGNSA